MNYLTLILFLVLSACQGNTRNGLVKNESDQMVVMKNYDPIIVEGSIGFIVESENYQFGDIIPVFDENQNKISEIIITEETEVLALKCLSRDKTVYEVLLDGSNVGYIPISEQKVEFQTWQEHVLNRLFAVGFNEENNPLRKEPSGDSKTIHYDQNEFYHPNQIKGEWLQVKWGSGDNWDYGWIRWRENDKLLIEMFYFA